MLGQIVETRSSSGGLPEQRPLTGGDTGFFLRAHERLHGDIDHEHMG